MAAGGPAAGGQRQASSLGRPKAGPSLDLNPSNPFHKPLEVQCKLALGQSEAAQCSLGTNLNGASRLLLNCPSGRQCLRLISLLTWLSTCMQSLEHSIKGSTKVGQAKTCQGGYLECSIPDSLYYLLSGFLTYF